MAKIIIHNGRPAISVGERVLPPYMATVRTMEDDCRIIFDKDYFKGLGDAGVKVFFLICDTLWLKPNAIELFRDEAEQLLSVCPDSYIIARIGMHPTNEWIEQNPDECIKYSDGSTISPRLITESYTATLPSHYSLCSSKWCERAGEALKETWRELMKLPYADRIIGCFFGAGGTSEWYYMSPVFDEAKRTCLDHSESFKREFTAYLTEKYATDEALQAAWGNPEATLLNPPIPSYDAHYFAGIVDRDAAIPKVRMISTANKPEPPCNGTNKGSFFDPDKHTDVFDFYRAWHLGSAKSVLHFAKIIKELTPDKLTGAFYGSQGCISFLRSGSNGGTLSLLDSPYVDFLAAPGVYENRQAGGFTGQRAVQDSYSLRGKMYIVEDDARTHAENDYFRNHYKVFDLTDTVNIMKREFGRTICEDVQAWWFDQLLRVKRYNFPEVLSLISAQQKIAEEAYSLDRRKNSEIAFIFDEESFQAISQQSTVDTVELLRNYEIARVGAPVDQYYHNDMSNPDMPSYKLYVFVNTYYLTNEEREAIRAKLKKDNATALWLYGSGVINPEAEERFSPKNIELLTGIKTEVNEENFAPAFRFNGEQHDIFASLDRRELFGNLSRKRLPMINGLVYNLNTYLDTYLCPLLYPADNDAKVLGYFSASEYPAVAIKEQDGFTSVYYGSKSIGSKVIREAARFAGCHIYTESDEVLFANKNYLTYHADSTGKKKIKLPEECSVYEVYENKLYSEGCTELEFEAYLGETKMFRLTRK